MKKSIILGSTVLMCGLLLVGCGTSSNNSASKGSSHENTASSTKVQSSESSAKPQSSSSSSQTDNSADLSSLQPKQVAASVLAIGAESQANWQGLYNRIGGSDGNLEIDLDTGKTAPKVTEPGTGMFYQLTAGGHGEGYVNGYTMSQDGKTIYLYTQQVFGSAERVVSPFKTISANDVIKASHQSGIDNMATNARIEENNY